MAVDIDGSTKLLIMHMGFKTLHSIISSVCTCALCCMAVTLYFCLQTADMFYMNLVSVYPLRDLRLGRNRYSWNQVANLLIVESPMLAL